MTDRPPPPEDPADIAAAELALGLLDGDERAAALRRVLAEPAFAREVEAWRDRFAQLFDLWPDAQPGDDVAERIDASLGIGGRRGVARGRFPWPTLAIVSTAVAAALLVFVGIRDVSPPAPVVFTQAPQPAASPLLVATLDADASLIAAAYDPAGGSLRIAPPPATEASRVAQLWIIGGDGVPHSVGLLGSGATILDIAPADRARIAAGATLAISIEPAGGSTTGLPTGPVVAKGALAST